MPSIRSIVLPFKAKFSGEDVKDRNRLFEAFAEVEKQLAAAVGGAGGLHFARVTRTANLTVPTATVTAIPFDGTIAQNGGMHSTASLNTRLTVFRAGIYTISGHVLWPATAVGVRSIRIRLNGSLDIARLNDEVTAVDREQSISTGYFLNAGDYAEITLFQNSGGNIAVVAAANYGMEGFIGEH